MFLSFSFSNLGPFNKKQSISFGAIKNIKSHSETLIHGKVLPITCFYGPNGGGKSNIFYAIDYVQKILGILRPHNLFVNYEMIINSINQNDINKASEFEFSFLEDNFVYVYYISLKREEKNVYSPIKVIEEYLYKQKYSSKKSNKKYFIFDIKKNFLNIKELTSNKISDLNYNNSLPFLMFISNIITSNNDINSIKQEISKLYVFDGSFLVRGRPWLSKEVMEKNKVKLLKYFKDLDFNILDFKFGPINPVTRAYDFNSLILTKEDNNFQKKDSNIDWESTGTIKIIIMLADINYILENGHTLIIDELDSSLHTSLLEYLINLFKDKTSNTGGAQLIFNSHDINTLNSRVFRSDEIYFSSLDDKHNGQIIRLSDFKVRDKSSYSNLYLKWCSSDPYIRHSIDHFINND